MYPLPPVKTSDADKQKKAVIIGAGPAGLTAAFELLKNTTIKLVVYEETDEIGGISRTVKFKGNLIDIGPHRFFSKRDEITNWWKNLMPVQLNHINNVTENDANQGVLLVCQRFTRILFLGKLFDYPISLKFQTFKNLGLINSVNAGLKYLWALFFKREEDTLENFYINRFGKPLYEMFFENYTKKVWGIHPSKLPSDWGSQRIKDISVLSVIGEMVQKTFLSKANQEKNRTKLWLTDQFLYPKYGAGQMWETAADNITQKGGEIHKSHKIIRININGNRVESVVIKKPDGEETVSCDYLFSSMPISELFTAFNGLKIPNEIIDITTKLPYRAHITIGLLVNKLLPVNKTGIKTPNNIIPDNWIYIQENIVNIGRIYIMNNFSPYMVRDNLNRVLLGVEYFCDEGDELWEMNESSLINMAICELVKINIIRKEDVVDAFQIKVKKAYPSYHGSYHRLDEVISFLNNIENLYCIGRNGQHRYNNMDHSMLTAIEAVKHLCSNPSDDKTELWNINTEKGYHESKDLT